MAVRQATQEDLNSLASLYKSYFKRHHVFEQAEEEIVNYLSKKAEENKDAVGLLVAEADGQVTGGLLVRKRFYDRQGKHLVVKYNHLAAKNQEAKEELLKYAEEKLKEKVKGDGFNSLKIEASFDENEKEDLELFKKHGFEVEGELKNHYRANELVTVVGKSLEL